MTKKNMRSPSKTNKPKVAAAKKPAAEAKAVRPGQALQGRGR
jgi:hypothetical protein